MWADEKNANWLGVWSHLSHCPACHTLMNSSQACPRCGYGFEPHEHTWTDKTGVERKVLRSITPGAFSVTTASLLSLMQREWERPVTPPEGRKAFVDGTSPKLVLVILFWTLFEHLMDRFFHTAVSRLPTGVGADLLARYASIGSRMNRLYKMLFETSMEADMASLGRGSAYAHLTKVQDKRNDFVHGNATAIDDALVHETVARLHEVQEAVVALFNLRCAGDPKAPPMWRDREAKTGRR
jgi:hypothetical protein